MTGRELLTSAWDFEPSVIVGSVALLLGYAAAVRLRFRPRALVFAGGVLLLFLALSSPLDVLGDDYLFCAHMAQHILLALAIPGLLVLGIPESLAAAVLSYPLVARIERVLSRPALAWSLAIGALWIWHVPPIFDAALADEKLHIFQHITFLVTGTIFWWPIFLPIEARRERPPIAVFYLVFACLASSVLGMILTFAEPGLYIAYIEPEDRLGILPLLRGRWGFTLSVDQEVGGLLMWIPCCFIYATAVLATIARWFREDERDKATVQGGPRGPAAART